MPCPNPPVYNKFLGPCSSLTMYRVPITTCIEYCGSGLARLRPRLFQTYARMRLVFIFQLVRRPDWIQMRERGLSLRLRVPVFVKCCLTNRILLPVSLDKLQLVKRIDDVKAQSDIYRSSIQARLQSTDAMVHVHYGHLMPTPQFLAAAALEIHDKQWAPKQVRYGNHGRDCSNDSEGLNSTCCVHELIYAWA